MIKAIIFDCFGVLAEDAWLPFKREHVGDDVQLAKEIVNLGKQNEYGVISNDSYYTQAAELMGVEEQQLRTILGRQVPNEELFAYIRSELKPKYKIGLLSNANYDVVHELFTPDQAELFDASVLSFESVLVKPDERMFQLVADRLGVLPEECLFIDDVERYCVAAEEFGMRSVLYQSVEQIQQTLR